MNIKNTIADAMKKAALCIKKYSDDELTTNCEWIEELYRICIRFRRLFRNYPIELFLSPYTEQLKRLFANDDTKNRVINMWMEKFDVSSDDIKMFISKLVFLTNSIQDDSSLKIMEFAQTTKNADYRYWTAMDISMFTFLASDGFYPNYYNNRKELLSRIVREQKIEIPARKNKSSKIRICIITFMYKGHIQSSVQRVVNMVTNAMSDRADEVMLISLESFYAGYGEGIKINTARRKTSARMYINKVKSMINQQVKVVYAKGDSIKKRMQDAVDKIYHFNPTCIIDISDEFSHISEVYSRDYPVIYMPLRISGSSMTYTRILGSDWMYKKANEKFGCIDISKVANWMLPEYVPPEGSAISRSDIKIKDNSFVIVSVGYNSSGFSNEMIDAMCNLLKEHKNYCWLFVGEDGSSYLHEKYSELLSNKKIIEHGYEKNLSGLYKTCDVLLRSETTGSSGATAIAAMQGLPIVMSDYECDPMRWLGKEYSLLHTPSELVSEIERLCDDKDYYVLKQKQVIELVNKATDENYWWDELFKMSIELGKRN